MKRILKTSGVIVLCWLFFGSLFYPYWFYHLFFEGGYRDWSHWWWGISFDVQTFGPLVVSTALTVWLVLALSRTTAPDRLLSVGKAFRDDFLFGKRAWLTLCTLGLCAIVSLSLIEIRSRTDRENERKLAESIARSEETVKQINEELNKTQKPPLSEPTSFIFVEKDGIASLYGQYEPELVPAVVVAEIQNSTEFKGRASIDEYLSTELGRKQYERQMTQYKQANKTPERQLRDLLKYLTEKRLLKRYTTFEPGSPDLKELDSATQLLTHKYDIIVDKQKLTTLRDKLLIAQRKDLEDQLQKLYGLVLVEGDWTVENRQYEYVLRRPFLEAVSNPPVCEVRLPKSAVAERNREIIDGLGKGPLRLAVFGNVLVGLSGKSHNVLLIPLAVFQ